jgi:predicted nucleotide-binding protein
MYNVQMARKTKPTIAPPSLAPTIGPEKALSRLQRLLDQIPELRTAGNRSPQLTTWNQDVENVLSQFYGRPSLQLEQFGHIHFSPMVFYTDMPESDFTEARMGGLATAEGFLQSRINELIEDLQEHQAEQQFVSKAEVAKDTRKVFVVHGHDHGSKESVARYLSRLGLEPVILHEQADQGRTIIEKFEHHAEVSCAVVILSPDDIASSKSNPAHQEERARQNVIFEMGFFVGRLGRKHTFALVQKGVTRPSDIDGVLYIHMDDDVTWRMRLVGELKASGMNVDANKAFN